jgi:hypothetical protein
MTGMWAPRPSMITRYLDETTEKSQILSIVNRFGIKHIQGGDTTRAV